MATQLPRRLFRDPSLVAAVFAVGALGLGTTGCKRPKIDPTQRVELINQACCQEADAELKNFKGCILTNRECPKSHKWWMRGRVTCTAVDEAGCSGGRCCNYIQQYDPKIGKGNPDWKPPGFADAPETEWSDKPEDAEEPEAPEAPAEPEEPEPPKEPAVPTIVVTLDGKGTPSMNGETLEGDTLSTRLCETAKALPDVALTVQAEADTPQAAVVPILEAAKGCKIKSVKLEQTTD